MKDVFIRQEKLGTQRKHGHVKPEETAAECHATTEVGIEVTQLYVKENQGLKGTARN